MTFRPRTALRYLWAAPNTLVGLALAAYTRLSGGHVQVVEGVVEACGGGGARLLEKAVPLPGGAEAMTIGHVVLARSRHAATRTRRHERVHVRQYERWGPFFLPAYFGAAAVQRLRGRDAYRDNPFEREAFGAG